MGGNKHKGRRKERCERILKDLSEHAEDLEESQKRAVERIAESLKRTTTKTYDPDKALQFADEHGKPLTGGLTFDCKPIRGFDAFSRARVSELAREGGAVKAHLEGRYECRPGVKKLIREEWDKIPALHDVWQAIARHHNVILAANTPQDGRCVSFLAAARPTAGFETFVTHRIIELFDFKGFFSRTDMLETVGLFSDYLGKVVRTMGVHALEVSKHSQWPFIKERITEWWEFNSKERIGFLNLGLCLMAAKCGFDNQIAHGSLGWGLMAKTANSVAAATTYEEYVSVWNNAVAKLVLADYGMVRERGAVTPFATRALTRRLNQTDANFTCIISPIINKLLETAVDEHGTFVAKHFESWERLVEDVACFENQLRIMPFETLTERSSYRMNIDDYFMAISNTVLTDTQHPFHQVVLQVCDSFRFVTDLGCVDPKKTAPRVPLVVVRTDDDDEEDDTTSDEPTVDDKELRDECRAAADKFSKQRADDVCKIPNLPAPVCSSSSSSKTAPKPESKPAPKLGTITKLCSETSILSKLPQKAMQDVKMRALENRLKKPLPAGDRLIALLEPGASEEVTSASLREAQVGTLISLAASAANFATQVKAKAAAKESQSNANDASPSEPMSHTERAQIARDAKKKKKATKALLKIDAEANCPAGWIGEMYHTSMPKLGTTEVGFCGFYDKKQRALWTIGTQWPATMDDLPPRITSYIHYDDVQKYDQDTHLPWKRLVATVNDAKQKLTVEKWQLAHSYTIDLDGNQIVYKGPTRPNTWLAYHSTLYSEITLKDGRVDRLTMAMDDTNGYRIVDLHYVRIFRLLSKEKAKEKGRAWEALSPEEKEKSRAEHKAKLEEKASAAAEELLRQEELENQERASKAKKKEDARRLREREQAEKARLVREASEGAAKALAVKQAEEKALHAEEQRRIAATKREAERREAEANFARTLAQKQAEEAEEAAAARAEAEAKAEEAARAEAEAAAVAWAEATARQAHEAKITATRTYASESRRAIEAQAEVMARYKPKTTSRPPPVQSAPPPLVAKAENDDDNDDDDSKLCVICMDAEKTQVCVPCGHRCLCAECAEANKPDKCPVCRADVSVVIRVFG